jgi:ATP-dependent RNA helicase DeaD
MKISEINVLAPIRKALETMGYTDLTAVQEQSLPLLLAGQDLLAEAPTGTGKTAAYCVPMLSRINPSSGSVQALVICPTRELVIQVVQEIAKFAADLPSIRFTAIYGGQKVNTQLRALKSNPQIIVGTPGRLNDLIARGSLSLAKVTYLVLDECDEMLEMGFIKDVNKIIEKVTSPHQTSLFSATISSEIKKVAERYLKKDAQSVQIKRTPTQQNQIAQKYVLVNEKEKTSAVSDLLNSLSFTRAFVFCRTKHKVKQLEKILQKQTSHTITSLQGNLSQNKRDKAMKDFRSYVADVMVATDIAARGIDVNDVDLVINYDVPEEDEFYLHRIGRTGRVDKSGTSYTFLTPSEKGLIKKYEAMSHCPLNEYVINKGDVMKKYLESLAPSLQADLSSEKAAIQEAMKSLSIQEGHDISALDVAAILLKEKMEEPDSALPQERDYSSHHNDSIERNKERKKFVTSPENQRFFINVGFEDGADQDSLKKFIVQHVPSLALPDFADLYLKGTFSFFEVPKAKSDAIISGIENTSFQGKSVHVEKTERPSEGGSKEKRFSHSSYSSHNKDKKDFHSDGRDRHFGHSSYRHK